MFLLIDNKINVHTFLLFYCLKGHITLHRETKKVIMCFVLVSIASMDSQFSFVRTYTHTHTHTRCFTGARRWSLY